MFQDHIFKTLDFSEVVFENFELGYIYDLVFFIWCIPDLFEVFLDTVADDGLIGEYFVDLILDCLIVGSVLDFWVGYSANPGEVVGDSLPRFDVLVDEDMSIDIDD